MIPRRFEKLLVRPEDLTPSADDLEIVGAFNPAAVEFDGGVALLVRVAERPRERRPGYTPLPRWQEGSVVTDWVADEQLEPIDARVVRQRGDGLWRLTSTSHLQALFSRDGRTIDAHGARLVPDGEMESFGVEDPRITFLDGQFQVTYVAVSRHGAATALAGSDDLRSFQRRGLIFCPENKDVVLFPGRIGGRAFALHRPTTAHPFCRPEMWIASSPDLVHWGAHRRLAGGAGECESDRVGAGPPPLRVETGWLEIYHASRRSPARGAVGAYVAGAVLLDESEPHRVRARTAAPLIEPSADFERAGFVPGVVFPTGVVQRGPILQVFYGAADTFCGVVELALADVLAALVAIE